MKTVKFYTLGCKVNQYETQSIRERFIQAGFQEIEDSQPANVYVINTCTVTHRADSGSLNLIRRAERENPKADIIVTGCLTELDSSKIANISGVTHIIKNKAKNRIVELLNGHNEPNGLNEPNGHNEPNGLNEPNGHNRLGITYFRGHTRAFLKIQDGCNNSCSYCKVPLVRGRSHSRDLWQIIQEAQGLVKNGFKEIVLCGICLGAYGKDLKSGINLVNVIEQLEKIKGLLRIRLSSIEAGDISGELINKMAQSKKLCRHLHIPIQSGDDEILKKMNRGYARDGYLGLINRIKKIIPQIGITTDVLVGFPGERQGHFQNTVELIKEILPLRAHIFPYSRRENTPAANFEPILSPKIIKERTIYLEKITQACALEYKRQFLNKNMEVLIEGRSKNKPDFWQGHTDNYIKVQVKSSQNLKNQIIFVKLKKIIGEGFLGIN